MGNNKIPVYKLRTFRGHIGGFLDKKTPVYIVLMCTFLGAAAQILFKIGVNNLKPLSVYTVILDYWLWIGYTFYGISAFLLIIALKKGELSSLYPIIATTYIWVSILSPLFFPSDHINIYKASGVFSIFIGVLLIGINSKRD